jgi:hypothetical protein
MLRRVCPGGIDTCFRSHPLHFVLSGGRLRKTYEMQKTSVMGGLLLPGGNGRFGPTAENCASRTRADRHSKSLRPSLRPQRLRDGVAGRASLYSLPPQRQPRPWGRNPAILAPGWEAPSPANARTLVCVEETLEEKGKYDSGEIAHLLHWDTTIVSLVTAPSTVASPHPHSMEKNRPT